MNKTNKTTQNKHTNMRTPSTAKMLLSMFLGLTTGILGIMILKSFIIKTHYQTADKKIWVGNDSSATVNLTSYMI